MKHNPPLSPIAGHYLNEKTKQPHKRLKAPRWLRKTFGDLRKEGTLDLQSMAIQGVGYIMMLVVFLSALFFDLTRQNVLVLVFLQLFLMAVAATLARYIVRRLLEGATAEKRK